ncbi:hypothetical protein M427DRAFT_319256 [Gonapodya prolifera JEL478]|uniref:UBA domain-containing protein n=1 Tax=Gonapodya prolifera (strain JEL478) TaxID=1344416 RepID=A0A139AYA0_GONPJ|nr:hypothetical protein M427DRAFT_319256 [Gonapodya prolifera JEL478]|eukprot:KXS21425.1 hypothetical protein M427DRAFT_319256 [Gonapodya prolifera JEL478]
MSYGGNDLGIDPRKYGTQLATLHRMGYRDDVLNLKALESVGGDPIEALAVLSGERPMPNLNLHSTSSSTPAPKLPSRQNTAGRLPQAPAVSIPPHLRSQVAQLQDMGFTDTARVLRALTDANGKVDDALEVLLRDQSANAPSTSSNRGRQQQTSQGQRPPPPPTEPPPRPRRDVDDLLGTLGLRTVGVGWGREGEMGGTRGTGEMVGNGEMGRCLTDGGNLPLFVRRD